MQFLEEMKDVKQSLEKSGHEVYAPLEMDNLGTSEAYLKNDEDRISVKIEFDFIRAHFKKIESAEAILILNYDKKGIVGYIGGNTFLEMGYAFGLGKKLYLLNPIPQMDYYTEMCALQPIILNGDLNKLQ